MPVPGYEEVFKEAPAAALNDKEWATWPDAQGVHYEAGDTVAIATVNMKSPQLVIGTVVSINRCNSKGEPIVRRRSNWATKIITVEPSATITVQPISDARGFYRTKDAQGKVRKVTYMFPENVVKL